MIQLLKNNPNVPAHMKNWYIDRERDVHEDNVLEKITIRMNFQYN